ncbi:MAG: 6-carboxytetrahydropterin synthase [Blastocatellia bacterium]|nr:6-carboxytetrahydropterin synthase [Blastocatellia bacterium]
MFEVMIEESFCAAHRLREEGDGPEPLHGHNWRIEVYVRGEKLDKRHILVDFRDVRAATKKVMDYLDHKFLNDLPPFDREMNPSTENIAVFILHEVAGMIDTEAYQVYKVRAWETPFNAVTYEIKPRV